MPGRCEGLAAVRQPASIVRLGALSTVEEGLLPQAIEQLHGESLDIRLQGEGETVFSIFESTDRLGKA